MDEMVAILKRLRDRLTKEEVSYWLWTLFVLKTEPWGGQHDAVLASLRRMEASLAGAVSFDPLRFHPGNI